MRGALAVLAFVLTVEVVEAGGSNYGIAPGARVKVEGRISEWKVPTPQFARDPAPGPDGNIYITVQSGNRIARLDTRTGAFTEYKTRGRPYGLALDRAGNVWFCEIAGDRLGRLDPRAGTITELELERGAEPRRIAAAPDGSLWVTLYGNGRLLRVDPASQKVVKAYALPAGERGGPYAVTVDGGGVVWVNEI